jgi:HEAT repeat protein
MACAPSTAARTALDHYQHDDFVRASTVAEAALRTHADDDELWRVWIRSTLAQGEPGLLARRYQKYQQARGSDDCALVEDLATATLGQGLTSRSAQLRVRAIQLVEEFELEALAEPVFDALGDDDDRVAAAAAVAVLRAHPDAPAIARDLMSSADPEARAIAVAGVARKLGDLAAADITQAARDPEAVVRLAALRALATIPGDDAMRSLIAGLRDLDARVRAQAAHSLAAARPANLTAHAHIALADANIAVRLAGVALLAAAKDHAALTALLTDPDPTVAITAAARLRRSSPAARAAIERGLRDPSASVRAGALNLAQAALDPVAAVELARGSLDDPGREVRLAAARVLLHNHLRDEAVAIFVAALATSDRLIAAADLIWADDPRGAETLTEAMDPGAPTERRRRAVLAHHVAGRITPGLVAALADASGELRLEAAGLLLRFARRGHSPRQEAR